MVTAKQVARYWTLDIAAPIPSANELMRGRSMRARRGRYKRVRDDMAWAVKVGAFETPAAKGKRCVRIVRIMGPRQREYDIDNLAHGSKPLVDELVAHGLLLDDSPRWAHIEYAQERGAEAGARVEIWEEQ